MKLLALTIFSVLMITLLMVGAQIYSQDASHANRVPHPAGTMLAVYFAHADHTHETCISCHHNYVDDTGTGMCFDCHKTDQEVAPLIEEQFHDLCRTCHEQKQSEGEVHGPTRECSACHIPDDLP